MQTPQLSAALQQELGAALSEYATRPVGSVDDGRLKAATERVCVEAHAQGMSPEGMVIALRQFYEAIPEGSALSQDRRRAAYDRLLSACIHAYFTAAVD